jgi:predicted YcjX-like family ATPase
VSVAVPAEVSCAVPITAELSQYVAAALQNVTVPGVTGDPLDTAAVNVTGVPEVTEEADNVKVVVVVALTDKVTVAVAIV